MNITAKSILATTKDIWAELLVGKETIGVGQPDAVHLRGENVDLSFTVAPVDWHHLRQPTKLRTHMGGKKFVTYIPAQVYSEDTVTLTVIQRVQFYSIRGRE